MADSVARHRWSVPADDTTLRPLPLGRALLYVGLPALRFRLALYATPPALMRLGRSPFAASVVSFTVPAAMLFALAVGFCARDGYAGSWHALKTRVRLRPMRGSDWLGSIAGVLVYHRIGGLAATAQLVIGAVPALAPPWFFPPWLTPSTSPDLGGWATFIGGPLLGNWRVAGMFS